MNSEKYAERNHRIDARQENVGWLAEHDLDENKIEAAQRLGLIKGDVNAIIKQLDNHDD